ncbi:MFS transporter [Haloechinothrix sp. LS1_15]|uniref:MFS transporter n=1 Tax=Haloechinothrix sp. LS1_15 TaxID=2652248 RepID=UPI0029443029|nr:MFS transporter [Haloechinothrix sp. LS1_15]MDV6014767.1 MFS transporter [Haloechinothrix sp. LS1_15]
MPDGPSLVQARAPTATRWPAVLVLVGAGVVASLHIGKAPGALPVIREELDLSLPVAGFVISGFNLVGALLGLALGAASDAVGHRRSAVGSLIAIGLASTLGAQASSAAPLLATRFAEGVAFMVVVLSVPGLLTRVSRSRDLGLVMGSWAAYMPTGTALMLLAAAPLVATVGWRGTWLFAAAVALSWAGLVAWVTRGTSPAARARGQGWARESRPTRAAVLLGLAFAAYAGQILAVLGFLPTMLVEEQGLGVAAAAMLTAAAFAVNAPGTVLGGLLQHRGLERWRMIVFTSAAMAVAAVVIYAEALPLAVRYAACVVMSLVGGFIPSVVLGAVPEVARSPRAVGAASGVAMQGANLGQLIAPPAVAALAGMVGGWHLTPLAIGLLAAAAATCGLALRGR